MPPQDDFLPPGPQEFKKRRREIFLILVVSFLFGFLTWFEVRMFATSQQLPFVHSIFFFGLVNFNIILLLLLFFMIFRNVVKVFVERQGKVFGSSLKAKLVAAFVSFSVVPTILMFIISVFYINSSFDKWFSVKMAGVLKSSIEVTNAYYFNAKKKNYHFAHKVAEAIAPLNSENAVEKKIDELREIYSVDAVEYYPSLFGKRLVVTSEEDNIPIVPAVSLEFLQKGIKQASEASTIHQFGEGNLVRVVVPVKTKSGANKGAVVVSSFLPLSLITKMNDVSTAYDEFRDINPLEYPLKSIYLYILVLMTFVILLAATWFGFYLAKQLAIPIIQLGRATKRVAEGDYTPLSLKSGSEEINALIGSFNQMTETLEDSLDELDQHARYMDIILKNVSAGVISVDNSGRITTVNRHAGFLLKVDAEKFIGRPVKELLTREYFRTFAELQKTMKEMKLDSLQKEMVLNIQGESMPLQITISNLKDDKGEDLGSVLVFDDMTPIVSAQRAAAWTEVARRIAHEIKNPLTPIKLSAERLQRKFGSTITDPAFSDCTTMIVKQVDGLKNLVNEFSNFARLPQARPVLANLNDAVAEPVKLYKQSHSQVSFVFERAEDLPEFKFDPDQINRVLVNLIDNAISAVAKEQHPEVFVSLNYDKDIKTVRLVVSDNGDGVSSADRSRIFEPYFSTKENGTGLGLAIVKRIIEDHNGFIRAIPNEPKGLKIVIEMPVYEVGAWKPSDT